MLRMAYLIVEKGSNKDIGKRHPLGETAIIIGRASSGNNPGIAVHDDFVSRQHAEIAYEQYRYMLRDLGSTNGTQLDGRRLAPGNSLPLMHNSVIGLGINREEARVVLRFKESPTTSTARIDINEVERTEPVDWLRIDEKKREVYADGKVLSLSKKEYQLMYFLSNRAGKVCSRDDIIAEVWPEAADPGGVSDAAIDQLIHRLRVKIEPDPLHPVRLVSKKGFGYLLV